uniref:Uncharacterized protein n=1 Tax=Bactrocera latifrons TaxID=174628 RepID=A0A0K8TYD9_BACLA
MSAKLDGLAYGRAIAITSKWPASTKGVALVEKLLIGSLLKKWHFCQMYQENLDSSSAINRANAEELIIPQFDYSPTPTTSNRSFSGHQNDETWSQFNNILKKPEELVAGKNNSPYAQVLACFDWLLNKLPQSIADDMCMEFNSMLLQKVKEFKSKK